jgi:flagellar biosynthetic protein FliS
MQNPYTKASKAYQKNNDEALSPLQIVVELYKGMLRNVREAKTCWQQGRLDVMTDHIIKTFNVIEALQANLDIVNGGEDAKFLNRFYNVIFSALTMATAKVEPEKEFDDIIAYIQQVHDRWYVMAYPNREFVPQAQIQNNSEQVSANA